MFKTNDVVVTTQSKVGIFLSMEQKVYNKVKRLFYDFEADAYDLTEDETVVDVAQVEFGNNIIDISASKLKLVQKVKIVCKQFGNEWEMIVKAEDLVFQAQLLRDNKIYYQVFER